MSDLSELIAKAKAAFDAMTPEEQRGHRIQQAISFVYGNLAVDRATPPDRAEVERIVREHYTKVDP